MAAPIVTVSDNAVEWRLPANGAFIITDEIGTELFRVTAAGDAVKVAGTQVTPSLQAVLNAVTATAAEISALHSQGAVAADFAKLHAVTASAAEVNALTGQGAVTTDIAKLHAVTASAAEINALTGQGATTTDIAKLHAITASAANLNALPPAGVTGVAAAYKLARGETALDGSNPTPVATGLTTVVAFAATLKGTAAPGDGTSVLTADISGTTVNVYAWMHTTGGVAGNPTLVASTGTESFYWIGIGT